VFDTLQYTQVNTNSISKTWTSYKTNGISKTWTSYKTNGISKDKLNIVFRWKSQQKSHYESENLEDIQFDMKNMNTIENRGCIQLLH
jgi:hypothetical protein